MERLLTEETVTKSIIAWLVEHNWKIICFDFPQSGTGTILHHNNRDLSHKNIGAFIPDIVAIKNGDVAIFENKDRFVKSDFNKITRLKNDDTHSISISNLLTGENKNNIFFGIGLPIKYTEQAMKYFDQVDFILGCETDMISVIYSNNNIFDD